MKKGNLIVLCVALLAVGVSGVALWGVYDARRGGAGVGLEEEMISRDPRGIPVPPDGVGIRS